MKRRHPGPAVVTQSRTAALVIPAASESEQLNGLDRSVLRLDDMPVDEIDEMLQAEIPPEHQYSLAGIPDK